MIPHIQAQRAGCKVGQRGANVRTSPRGAPRRVSPEQPLCSSSVTTETSFGKEGGGRWRDTLRCVAVGSACVPHLSHAAHGVGSGGGSALKEPLCETDDPITALVSFCVETLFSQNSCVKPTLLQTC